MALKFLGMRREGMSVADEQLWPTPRYAEEIVFEGCAHLVIAPEDYEALYNAHEALRAQLEQTQAERSDLMRDTTALEELRKVIAEAEGCDVKTWPGHGNKALAIAAQYTLNLQTIARQRAWIESAGHRPGCAITKCKAYPGCSGGQYSPVHSARHFAFEHVFIPSPCDCGWAKQMEEKP